MFFALNLTTLDALATMMETMAVGKTAHEAAQWISNEVDVATAITETKTVTAKNVADVIATEVVVETVIETIVKTVSAAATETDEIGGTETTVEETVDLDVAEIAIDATVAAAAEVVAENVAVADALVPDLDLVQKREGHDQDHQETAVVAVMVEDEAAVAETVTKTIVVTDVIVATTIRAVDLDAEEETAETDVDKEMAVRKRLRMKTTKTKKVVTTLNLTVTTVTSSRMLNVMMEVMTMAHPETEAWTTKTTLLGKNANNSKIQAALKLQSKTKRLAK